MRNFSVKIKVPELPPVSDKINPHAPRKTLANYEAYSWCFDFSADWNLYRDWSSSYSHYPSSNLLAYTNDDEYEHHHIWQNYVHSSFDMNRVNWETIPYSYPITMKQFFIAQQIDTPISLKIKQSPLRPILKHPSTNLVGMLARHGKHTKIRISYLWAYNYLIRKFSYPLIHTNDTTGAPFLFNLMLNIPNNLFTSELHEFEPTKVSILSERGDLLDEIKYLKYNHSIEKDYLHFSTEKIFYRILFDLLREYYPVFSMKARRVDKLRYKHSRGKSGKYLVEWRYIPRYKRLNSVLRWLTEDVVLQRASTFRNQILNSLNLLLTNPSEHLVSKNRNYVHKYVYSRYRQSLLRTLKKTLN